MRKIYQKPTIEVLRIQSATILADSLTSTSNNAEITVGEDGSDIPGRSREFWEPEDPLESIGIPSFILH